ncbi:MAG: Ig-like domain-containing protein [Bacteroidota bacterium]
MIFKSKIPIFFIAGLAWVVIISSCANIGMPSGGPKDSIPPVLLGTSPEYKELNYKGDDVRLTFNEYIKTDEISEELVISPPLTKRTSIRTRSKTLIIQFNEDLKDSTTYSFDFKNSVADNNESNPLKNLRFSFSTGNVYDSLRVAGKVMNAFNLEPLEKGLVLLQSNLHDSAVFRIRPDYIAKTDETGLFMIDNIAPGNYHIFALNDLNGDLMYNEGAEEIAFVDSVIIPSAEFYQEVDTLVKGVDSLMVLGHTHFHPDPFYLPYFTEDIFEQYIDSYERETRNRCLFLFNESVKDTFTINLLNAESDNWQLLEYNRKMDSLVLWITDTIVARQDSLLMELSYFQLDTAGERYVYKDTLLMTFKDKKVDTKKRRKRKDEDKAEPEPIPQFNWLSNLSSTMELNSAVNIIVPEPIAFFDSTKILLHLTDDTLKTPLKYTFRKNKTAWRSYNIFYKWEPEESYTLTIDSAACFNIYGISSREMTRKFKIREEDYYGTINLNLTNVTMPMLVQLLKNSDEEEVLKQRTIDKDGPVLFDFIAPGKYKLKVIYDENSNGKWDTGSYQDRYHPEKVSYSSEVEKVRSNWDSELNWDLTPDLTFTKNIRDKELEEQKRKAAEEKVRQQKDEQQKNSMFKPGNKSTSGSGGNMRMK